ncbi:Surface antigen family protein [Burkholderiales bacterium]|nr:Surface antigen family protein [Burkholderiales bacterium]
MSDSNQPSSALAADTPGLSAADRLRRIHPLVATAAIAVTAVSVIAAVQFLAPQSARSAADRGAVAPVSRAVPAHAPAPAPIAVCADCGEVVNIRPSRQEGSGSGLGAVAGGVLGGVLGHQVGAGRGKEAMTVVGAVGGAFAGNEVEKQAKAQTLYLVDIRMADGSARTITETAPPNVPIGAKVRVSGNTIALR